MYLFGKITVTPQLPKRISGLRDLAYNLWWSWNTYALELYDYIDVDLFKKVNKNPVKFLSEINQQRLVEVAEDAEFLKDYDMVMDAFNGYLNAENTYYNTTYANHKDDVVAYFSAEYGLDEIIPIYAGGLGILSGDHCKSASDLGIPFVPVGLLYKQGYFNQFINRDGSELFDYAPADISSLPILPVYDKDGNELIMPLRFPNRIVYLKIWQIHIGRVTLYLMDSDIDMNTETDRGLTLKLYGGNQEMRICQEIILGVGGMKLLEMLGINATVYHMNEGHSSFAIFKIIQKFMQEKNVSFDVAKKMASACTIFTTHTPVPAGNDIFPVDLVNKYFSTYYDELGITRTEFLNMGAKYESESTQQFNMAVLALKVAGKKNGVSKLHSQVSQKLFTELWPNIETNEIPITHVTNGVHTCTWLAPTLKALYNTYMRPFWQEKTYDAEVWNDIDNIPDEKLWEAHMVQKKKLVRLVRENIRNQKLRNGASLEELNDVEKLLDPNVLTIGFARRFATYKRADLIFRDLERITNILNNPMRPVQIIFAGKPHPADIQGQELVKHIYEISNQPQFKGKVVILENYNMYISRYLVSGVDIWLNNPRRPLEASGTSGEKAGLNGVINFSILDGWWLEGYNGENGWAIGDETEYNNYEIQDSNDSLSIYTTLENEIIPAYYDKADMTQNTKWLKMMKNSIKSVGGVYNTGRMLCEYLSKLYMPQMDLITSDKYATKNIEDFLSWEQNIRENWDTISIKASDNLEEISKSAGDVIDMKCIVDLGNINPQDVSVEIFYGKFDHTNKLINSGFVPMKLLNSLDNNKYEYVADITLDDGGNYGYTFRVTPTHPLLINSQDMCLCKWLTN